MTYGKVPILSVANAVEFDASVVNYCFILFLLLDICYSFDNGNCCCPFTVTTASQLFYLLLCLSFHGLKVHDVREVQTHLSFAMSKPEKQNLNRA